MQLIKFGGNRQFSVPNPPLLLAANRYRAFLNGRTIRNNHTAIMIISGRKMKITKAI